MFTKTQTEKINQLPMKLYRSFVTNSAQASPYGGLMIPNNTFSLNLGRYGSTSSSGGYGYYVSFDIKKIRQVEEKKIH